MVDSALDKPEPGRERRGATGGRKPEGRPHSEGPDVYLNVPLLKVDEISIGVENLEAHVSLAAGVLDLLKLNVGADAYLGKVDLEIKGVEAQALLEVRLDNVAIIVDRVLTTLDRNPEILQHIGRGAEAAARGIGQGAGKAVGEVGAGAKGAVEDVGKGAGGAVEGVGRGAGGAVEDVGKGAGGAVEDVGRGAGGAVEDVGKGTGRVAEGVGETAKDAGKSIGGVAAGVSDGAAGGKGEGEGEETAGPDEGDVGHPKSAESGRDAGAGAGQESGDGRSQAGSRNTDEPEHTKTSAHVGGDGGDLDDMTSLQAALRETRRSVRDLGRAVVRVAAKQGPPLR